MALAIAPMPAFAASAAEGEWLLGDDAGRVRIAPCPGEANKLCGTIIAIKARPAGQPAPKTKDGKPTRDPQSMVGQTIMVGFKPNGEGKWNGGKFQFPGSDKSINATLKMNKDGTLRVNGCVLLLCGGQDWRRPPTP